MQVGKKRQAKNDKFGFGGRKRLKKQNDAGSAADMDSFRQGRFQTGSGRGRGASGEESWPSAGFMPALRLCLFQLGQ